MSHFVVAVFSHDPKDVDALLAPYDEQDEKYMEFCPCNESREKLEAEYQNFKDAYPDFDAFVKAEYGYEKCRGVWGQWYNPCAKWDWYQKGGRWNGMLRLKAGGTADEALVKEVDWLPDEAKLRAAERFWEVVVEGQPLQPGEQEEDFFSLWKPEYYVEQFGTKEHYAMAQASIMPFAMITADGEWLETGELGWFGAHSGTGDTRKTFENRFAQYVQENPDLYVTMVDCHI